MSGNPKYRNFIHGVTTIVKEQGVSGTYKGLIPTIFKQGSNQAIRFFVYGEVTKVKKIINRKLFLKGEKRTLKVHETILAGAIAGNFNS